MTEELLPLCECGCSEPVAKEGNRFIRNHHLRKEKIIVECYTCKKKMERSLCYISDHNFCCEKCLKEWQSERQKNKNNLNYNGGKKSVLCDNCNKNLEKNDWEIHDHNFCNHRCRGEWESENRIGDKASNWKGGISFEPYCVKFNESLKDAHRRYFNYLCFMDNEPEENGYKLSDHHVGYDKRCGCDAPNFCIFVPVKKKWNTIFNGNSEKNKWYWYTFLMKKIFMEHPNYFTYHIPVWGMNELEYNYSYTFEKFRRR